MSGKATFWAWKQAGIAGNNKLVLLCYADFANEQNLSYPSKLTVAKLCGVSLNTVKRSVKWLIDNGYFADTGRQQTCSTVDKKYRETAVYQLNIDSSTRATGNQVQNEPSPNEVSKTGQPGPNEVSTRATVAPNPTNKPTNNNKPTTIVDTGIESIPFDRFWQTYPRKTNKIKAEVAWRKLKPDKALLDLITKNIADRLMAGDWSVDRPEFVPHASTYLNQHRWRDQIISRSAATQQYKSADQIRREKNAAAFDRFLKNHEGDKNGSQRAMQSAENYGNDVYEGYYERVD